MGRSKEKGNTNGNLYSGNPLVGSKLDLVDPLRRMDAFLSGTGFLGIVYCNERFEAVLLANGKTPSFSSSASLLR